jgi:hypothetical protein
MLGNVGAAASLITPTLTAVSDPQFSVVTPAGGNRPQSSLRFNSNGDIEEASGNTGGALSYSKVGEWLNDTSGVTGSEWELNFTVDSEDTGDPGTWFGDARGSYIDLSSTRTFTWEKDDSTNGTANSEVTITLRNVATPGNSTSRSNISFDAEISS